MVIQATHSGYWITQKNNSIHKAIETESPSLKQKILSQVCREGYQWLKVKLEKWDVSVHFLIPRSANRGRGKLINATSAPSVGKIANYEKLLHEKSKTTLEQS